MMKKLRTLLSVALFGIAGQAQSQYLVSSDSLSTSFAFTLGFVPGIPANYDVTYYKLTYNTVDTQGEPTVASGAVAIPQSTECNVFPIVAYCHGTVLRQNDVPSAENAEGFITKIFSTPGYIAVAPDYLGLGVNPGRHPYIHAESEATATIDLLRATEEFLQTINISSNGQTFITGYSQGGHAAMAALKYAQDNNLNAELGIVAGAPCSGPYNLSEAQTEILLSGEPYSNPGYVVYILTAYQLAYGNLYENLGDVIQSPYAEQMAPYFDGMQNQYNMDVVNALLPNTLDELLVDSVLENFSANPNHPLRLNLMDNDNFDWTPEVPLRMFYCSGDEQVNFQNSIVAETTMTQNGAADVEAINSQPGASHGGCVIPALADAFEFFQTFADPCSFIAGLQNQKPLPLEVYPNPAHNRLTIVLPSSGYLRVYDIYGKTVLQEKLFSNTNLVDISVLAAGTYALSVNDENSLRTARIVIE